MLNKLINGWSQAWRCWVWILEETAAEVRMVSFVNQNGASLIRSLGVLYQGI